ncbi:hypothetical protein LTR94_035189, partial [Friedmanniomyces endolithicus]
MFFDDPVAGFADMARAARGGAPLVFSCFRSRIENDWSGAVDRVLGQAAPADGHAPGPYALADRERTYRILHDAKGAPAGDIFTDRTPRQQTFEGFYDWMVAS